MIIYCAGAIKGDTRFQNNFKEIVRYLSSQDHTPLSELNETFKTTVPLTERQIFKRDVKWLEKSSAVVAEISGASLGVGFEISYALYELKIPVLALYNSQAERVSAMITGCDSKRLTVKVYSDLEEMKELVSTFIKKIQGNN